MIDCYFKLRILCVTVYDIIIIITVCQSGTCTLREAVIIGSVLTKTSIPVLHSSAALLKLAEMEYSGIYHLFTLIV